MEQTTSSDPRRLALRTGGQASTASCWHMRRPKLAADGALSARWGRGMSGLSSPVSARRPEAAVLAALGRDVAVTTAVLAPTAPVVNEFQRHGGVCRPGQLACSWVPDTAWRAGRR